MKNIFLLGTLACLAIGCQDNNANNNNSGTNIINNPSTASESAPEQKMPELSFDNIRFDFGEVVEGDFVEHKFVFTNTGKADLLIHDVRAECGCTVPNDWPKQAVKPGESSSVSVKFNTEGKEGQQVKRITITANTYPVENVVALAGEVKKKQ